MAKEIEKQMAPTEPPNDRPFFRWGAAGSGVYLGGLAIYAFCQWPQILEMKPNELGDSLAGVFAPLAFLWLVLGFLQQGAELRHSARALYLQGEELRNSVEQQRALVDVTREQLQAESEGRRREDEDLERAAQPRFSVTVGGSHAGNRTVMNLKFAVHGANISAVELSTEGREPIARAHLGAGETLGMQFAYTLPEEGKPVNVTLSYDDQRGNRRAQTFEFAVFNPPQLGARPTLKEPSEPPAIERLD